MKNSKTSNVILGKSEIPQFGSTTRLHKDRLNAIIKTLPLGTELCTSDKIIAQKIKEERKARKFIFELRDKSVRPHRHNPSNSELNSALEALRVLFLLLLPFERKPGETNRAFFLRTLDDVGKYRKVDMFFTEE